MCPKAGHYSRWSISRFGSCIWRRIRFQEADRNISWTSQALVRSRQEKDRSAVICEEGIDRLRYHACTSVTLARRLRVRMSQPSRYDISALTLRMLRIHRDLYTFDSVRGWKPWVTEEVTVMKNSSTLHEDAMRLLRMELSESRCSVSLNCRDSQSVHTKNARYKVQDKEANNSWAMSGHGMRVWILVQRYWCHAMRMMNEICQCKNCA